MQSVRRAVRNSVAAVVRDKRQHAPYSWGWLNNLAAELSATHPSAEIRPAYTWGVVQAAALARALGQPRVSVVEFGVAGGRGLRALEQIAAAVEPRIPGVRIDVVGFDTGTGLPTPADYRDHPNLYAEGGYRMDEAALRASLTRAQLVLGDVADTVVPWLAAGPAPVGFVSWDLDYYSSTMAAFRLLEGPAAALLPRVVSYFDDIMGLTFGDHVGERAAIDDFNAAHDCRKISAVYGLRHYVPWPHSTALWPDTIYLAHLFDHPRYNDEDGLIATDHAPLGRA